MAKARRKRLGREALQQQGGLFRRQLAVEECGQLFVQDIAHGLISNGTGAAERSIRHSSVRPRPAAKIGRSFLSIASRARKIRERTVPTGQSIAAAISS